MEKTKKKRLRSGYTTGSCAAAAAQAAVHMMLSGKDVPEVRLDTPKGITLFLEPADSVWNSEEASCAIQKDAGDDPDVTNGVFVYAHVRKCGKEEAVKRMHFFPDEADPDADVVVAIEGAEGVGKVTLPGLEQPVGAPAINRVPRQMITEEIKRICAQFDYHGGIVVTVSIPAGEKLTAQTFNPRLGIMGGISVLGTSGIVEPMSERALIETIGVEMRQKGYDRQYLLITPGNYGTDYLKGHFPFPDDEAVKCSNYVGQTIDMAVEQELSGILFVAHIGKFIKVAGGIMNTHSKDADARMEILASCALRAGGSAKTARSILDCVTTDEGLRVIREAGLFEPSMKIMTEKIDDYLKHRARGMLKTGAVIFSNVFGELGRTQDVPELLEALKKERGMEECSVL